MMNLFDQAIEKNELLEFALGKNEYFSIDRDYGDHSVIASWINYILPLIELKGIDFVSREIEKMLETLLESNIENDKKCETLLYQLHVCYYLASEGRIKLDLSNSLINRSLSLLENYLELLVKGNDSKVEAVRSTVNLIKTRSGLK